MTATVSKGGHRLDIDGLRAVAVLSVIAFHIDRAWLAGGYLGVDVFFVLSGFLITSIIWREAAEGGGGFSILRFYDRRIRRIMPALLLVVALVTLAASLILLPSDLVGYGKSVLAALSFVANIFFWRDTDYFGGIAEQKPLLHLWSLGVEEQFYIAVPFILAFLARRMKAAALPVMLAGVVGSFLLNMYFLKIGGQSPAFYLLPMRAWELGAGAVLALLPARVAVRGLAAHGVNLVGAALVVAGLVTPYPPTVIPTALPVIVGTCMMLWTADGPVSRLLSWRPVVFVGLISYSLYLWHWPTLVLSKYFLIRDLTLPETALALAFMFAGATISWRWIEGPFRVSARGGGPSSLAVALAAAAGAGLLALAAFGIILSHGLPQRLSPAAALMNAASGTHYRCPVSKYLALGGARACELNLPSRDPADARVVLIGNSHAQMYAPIVSGILQRASVEGLLVPVNGCMPMTSANLTPACAELMTRNLQSVVALKSARTVVIATTWRPEDLAFRPAGLTGDEAFAAGLDETISLLERAGKRVILVGPIATPGWEVSSIVSRELAFGRPVARPLFTPRAAFEARYGALIRHFEARPGLTFVRPDRLQCPADRCEFARDGRALFSDSHHLAREALPIFEPAFVAARIAP